ncbi:MAG: Rpn family recombination-promoting nuclease/putative transposase [Treponema sp.]|nr:Rpn family recombination-promoting nuclease/putative transposase [Treponema sp.]
MEQQNTAQLSPHGIIPWEEVTLSNNYMFNKVMTSNPDLCRRFIEHLLHIKIEKIDFPIGEFTLEADAESRGVRLDVYVRDNNGLRVFDLEMQISNKHNLPERARYYQGMMDQSDLQIGGQFESLKTSYILFLCLFDPFDKNLPVYTFQNCCEEDSGILLNDRSYKVFYNISSWEDVGDTELQAIYKLILENQSSTDFTDELRKQMNYARQNVQYRQGYMTLAWMRAEDRREAKEEGIAIGLAEGEARGSRTAKLEAARNLLALHILTEEQIAQAQGLSLAEVQQLAAEQAV